MPYMQIDILPAHLFITNINKQLAVRTLAKQETDLILELHAYRDKVKMIIY